MIHKVNSMLKYYLCENNLVNFFMKERQQYVIGALDIHQVMRP